MAAETEPIHNDYGPSGRFNTTHWSVVLNAGNQQSSEGASALEKLCQTYWPPLYFFAVRKGYTDADAKDLTQQFFLTLLQRNDFSRLDRARGRFRTFLLAAFTHFLANEYDRANAQKRGGGKIIVSLDCLGEEQLRQYETLQNHDSGEAFDRQWAVSILARALERLKEEFSTGSRAAQFALLKPFLTGDGSATDYAVVAAQLGVAEASVPVQVHRLRQRYRELVRDEVGQTVSSPTELEEELRHLFHALSK
jgi:DNA-directed RNA polymerase specialized sigma24 family protein